MVGELFDEREGYCICTKILVGFEVKESWTNISIVLRCEEVELMLNIGFIQEIFTKIDLGVKLLIKLWLITGDGFKLMV